MKMNDENASFGGLNTEEEKGFFWEDKPTRAIAFANDWQNSLTIELSLD